jgi:hypothetical protein
VRRLPALAAAAVLALGLGACGKSGEKSEATTTMPTTTTTTLAAGPGGQFCDLVRSYNSRIQELASSLADPESLRKVLQDAEPVIEQAETLAPPEVAGDVKLLAASSRQLLAALQAVNFDVTKLAPAEIEKVQTPEVRAAQGRLQAYTRDVCRVGVGQQQQPTG